MHAPRPRQPYLENEVLPPSVHTSTVFMGRLSHFYTAIREDRPTHFNAMCHYTDSRGHFRPIEGALLSCRYRVVDIIRCRGQSATLIRAQDSIQCDRNVVIKALHASSGYFDVGCHEARTLRQLLIADPHGFSHTVRLLNTFTCGKHYCLVFEALEPTPITHVLSSLHLSHEQLLKTLRKLTLQLLMAAGFLKQNNVIHADLKPENILLANLKDINSVRVIDFGNSIHNVHREMSLYYKDFEVQSLLYRAPEVHFGIHFGAEIDMWSIGCILAEIYLGQPLIFGTTKTDILQSMVETLGPLPRPLFSQGKFYEQLKRFTQKDADQSDVTVRLLKRLQRYHVPDYCFVSFLAGLLKYDPGERLTIHQAACHPFLAPEVCLSYLLAPSDPCQKSASAVFISPSEYRHSPRISSPVQRQCPSSIDLLRIGTGSSSRLYAEAPASCRSGLEESSCQESRAARRRIVAQSRSPSRGLGSVLNSLGHSCSSVAREHSRLPIGEVVSTGNDLGECSLTKRRGHFSSPAPSSCSSSRRRCSRYKIRSNLMTKEHSAGDSAPVSVSSLTTSSGWSDSEDNEALTFGPGQNASQGSRVLPSGNPEWRRSLNVATRQDESPQELNMFCRPRREHSALSRQGASLSGPDVHLSGPDVHLSGPDVHLSGQNAAVSRCGAASLGCDADLSGQNADLLGQAANIPWQETPVDASVQQVPAAGTSNHVYKVESFSPVAVTITTDWDLPAMTNFRHQKGCRATSNGSDHVRSRLPKPGQNTAAETAAQRVSAAGASGCGYTMNAFGSNPATAFTQREAAVTADGWHKDSTDHRTNRLWKASQHTLQDTSAEAGSMGHRTNRLRKAAQDTLEETSAQQVTGAGTSDCIYEADPFSSAPRTTSTEPEPVVTTECWWKRPDKWIIHSSPQKHQLASAPVDRPVLHASHPLHRHAVSHTDLDATYTVEEIDSDGPSATHRLWASNADRCLSRFAPLQQNSPGGESPSLQQVSPSSGESPSQQQVSPGSRESPSQQQVSPVGGHSPMHQQVSPRDGESPPPQQVSPVGAQSPPSAAARQTVTSVQQRDRRCSSLRDVQRAELAADVNRASCEQPPCASVCSEPKSQTCIASLSSAPHSGTSTGWPNSTSTNCGVAGHSRTVQVDAFHWQHTPPHDVLFDSDSSSGDSDSSVLQSLLSALVRKAFAGEDRMIDSGEGRKTPAREGRTIASGEGGKTPAREGRMIHSGEGRDTPAREGRMIDSGEGGKTSAREGRTIHSGEGRDTPAREGRTIASGEGGKTSAREGRMMDSKKGGKTPAREGRMIDSGEGGKTSAREGRMTDSGEGRDTPAREGRMIHSGEDRETPTGEGRRTLAAREGRPALSGEDRKTCSGESREIFAREGRQALSGVVRKTFLGENGKTWSGESREIFAMESRQTLSGEGRKTLSGEGRKTIPGEGRKTPVWEGRRESSAGESREIPTEESRNLSAKEGRETPAQEGKVTPSGEVRKASTGEGRKTCAKEGRETIAKDSGKTLSGEGRKTYAREKGKTPAWQCRKTCIGENEETPAVKGRKMCAEANGKTPAGEDRKICAGKDRETPAQKGGEMPSGKDRKTPAEEPPGRLTTGETGSRSRCQPGGVDSSSWSNLSVTGQRDGSVHSVTDPRDNSGHTVTDQRDNSGHTVTDQGDNSGRKVTDRRDNSSHTVTDQRDNSGHTVTDQRDNSGHTVTDHRDNSGHTVTHQSGDSVDTITNQTRRRNPVSLAAGQRDGSVHTVTDDSGQRSFHNDSVPLSSSSHGVASADMTGLHNRLDKASNNAGHQAASESCRYTCMMPSSQTKRSLAKCTGDAPGDSVQSGTEVREPLPEKPAPTAAKREPSCSNSYAVPLPAIQRTGRVAQRNRSGIKNCSILNTPQGRRPAAETVSLTSSEREEKAFSPRRAKSRAKAGICTLGGYTVVEHLQYRFTKFPAHHDAFRPAAALDTEVSALAEQHAKSTSGKKKPQVSLSGETFDSEAGPSVGQKKPRGQPKSSLVKAVKSAEGNPGCTGPQSQEKPGKISLTEPWEPAQARELPHRKRTRAKRQLAFAEELAGKQRGLTGRHRSMVGTTVESGPGSCAVSSVPPPNDQPASTPLPSPLMQKKRRKRRGSAQHAERGNQDSKRRRLESRGVSLKTSDVQAQRLEPKRVLRKTSNMQASTSAVAQRPSSPSDETETTMSSLQAGGNGCQSDLHTRGNVSQTHPSTPGQVSSKAPAAVTCATAEGPWQVAVDSTDPGDEDRNMVDLPSDEPDGSRDPVMMVELANPGMTNNSRFTGHFSPGDFLAEVTLSRNNKNHQSSTACIGCPDTSDDEVMLL